jgi:SAM-dependent methyltransferase
MRDPLLDLYELPAYYDVLFPRDYAAECDFLEAILRTHGRVCATERSFLELGCGPARNARELARRGYRAVGLDLSSEMLAFARQAAKKEHLALEFVQGDMTDFRLEQPLALAACLWDTVLVLVENDAMVRHLRAVARNLLPGGVYVIETTHPSFMFDAYVGSVYRGRLGDVEVELVWGRTDDPYDAIRQVHTTSSQFTARRGEEILVQQRQTLPQRWYQVQELRALIELSGAFSEVCYYGRSRLPLLPLSESPECDGMLAVLLKR